MQDTSLGSPGVRFSIHSFPATSHPYPQPDLSHLFFCFLSLACSPLQAILPCPFSPFFSLLCLSGSYCLLFMMTIFYNLYKTIHILGLLVVLGAQWRKNHTGIEFLQQLSNKWNETILVLGWLLKRIYLDFMYLCQNRISRDGHVSLHWISKNTIEIFN